MTTFALADERTTAIPQELARADSQCKAAWKRYHSLCDQYSWATLREKNEARQVAESFDIVYHDWYARWQAVGGTSDIDSIVEAEIVLRQVSETDALLLSVWVDHAEVMDIPDQLSVDPRSPAERDADTFAAETTATQCGAISDTTPKEVIFGSKEWFDNIPEIEF